MKTIHLQALQCPNCGAPARVAAEVPSYACPYCRAAFTVVHEPAPLPPPPPAIAPLGYGAPPPPAAGGAAAIVLVTVALSAIGVIGGIVATVSTSRSSSPSFSLPSLPTLPGGPASWSGSAPLVCSGNDIVFGKDVKAKLAASPAILARDNCVVLFTDVSVEAPVGVRASENAMVSFDHGAALGSSAWFETSDNATVTANRARTAGAQRSTPSKPPPAGGTTGDPIVCRANDRLKIRGVTVRRATGAALVVKDNCVVELFDCKLEAPVGVVASGNGEVKLHNCDIRAQNGVFGAANADILLDHGSIVARDKAVDVSGNAGFESMAARVEGSRTASGNAKLRPAP
jgi:hypothetical protein